jgi:aminoglycoside 6'-N-acetyltransferase I
MTISIYTVRHEQFAEWLRLRTAVYTGIDLEFHDQEMRRFLADDSKRCFVADFGCGAVCGMIEVSLRNVVDGCLTSPVGYIEGVYIDPAQRGAGLSRRLLQYAEEWCRSMGCTEIATDAEFENEEAQRFHEHMGFEETYRIVEYRKKL